MTPSRSSSHPVPADRGPASADSGPIRAHCGALLAAFAALLGARVGEEVSWAAPTLAGCALVAGPPLVILFLARLTRGARSWEAEAMPRE